MDVEERIAGLFGLPPEEFIAARDQLARQLKADGDAAGAKRVSALRRPTVAAWAVNQATRERPELVRELLEAGDRLHQAQRRALSGLRGGGLREAGAGRRAAVDRLAAVAAEALERSGRSPDPHRDAISSTLQAASVDGEAAAALRAGTLSKELALPSGFGDAGGLSLVQPLPSEAAEPKATPEPAGGRGRGGRGAAATGRRRAGEGGAGAATRRDGRATAARRRELEAARRRRDELQRQAAKAERAAAKAREAAGEAGEVEDAASAEAGRLADAARQARQAAEQARRAAEQARLAADDARQEADTAKTRSQRAARRARAADGEAAEADDAAREARRALERAERELAELEPAD
jgi:hypothetical protein